MRKKLACLCLALAVLLPAWPAQGEAPPETADNTPSAPAAEETPPPETPPIDVFPTEAPPIQETPNPQETPVPEPTPEPTPEATPVPSASPMGEEPGEEDPVSPEASPSLSPSPSPSASPEPEEEPIRVMVPESGQVVVNPYNMSVKVDGENRTEQVIHQAQGIRNLGQVPVVMNVQAVGQAVGESRVRFVAMPPSQGDQGQEAFVYAEFGNQPNSWSGAYTDAGNQVLITEEGRGKAGVLRLEPESEGYFRLFGSLSVPEQDMWTESDTIRVRLIFNFSALES